MQSSCEMPPLLCLLRLAGGPKTGCCLPVGCDPAPAHIFILTKQIPRTESWWIALQLSVKSVAVELKLFHITHLCPPAWPDLFAFFCSSCPNFPSSLSKMPNSSPPSTLQDSSSTVAPIHELKHPELLVLFLSVSDVGTLHSAASVLL